MNSKISIADLITEDSLENAAHKVMRKSSTGIDGVSAKEACNIVASNGKEILKAIINGSYLPDDVRIAHILKHRGCNDTRAIAIATTRDRIVQSAIAIELQDVFNEGMSSSSFGFRPNLNCIKAVQALIGYIKDGYSYTIKLDMTGCFDCLSQDMILYKLRQSLPDDVMKLLNRFLKVHVIDGKDRRKNMVGAAQGSALSPLYANLVLDVVDDELTRRNHPFVRYADDICILCKSEESAIRTMRNTTRFIEKKCKLSVNESKSYIHNIADGINFLGYRIYGSTDDIHIIPIPSKVTKLKVRIKELCSSGNTQDITKALNELVTGWLNYYSMTEMNRVTKELDYFIGKEVKKACRRNYSYIEQVKILSCNGLYKKFRHQEVMAKEDTKKVLLNGVNVTL